MPTLETARLVLLPLSRAVLERRERRRERPREDGEESDPAAAI